MIAILVVFIVALVLAVLASKFIMDANQKKSFEKAVASNDNILLKKFSHSNLEGFTKTFATFGLTFTLVFVLWAFEFKTYDDAGLVDLGSVEDDFEDIMDIPPTEQPPPPPPKVQLPEIVEVPDEEEIEEDIEIELDVEVTEETVVEDIVFDEAPEEEVVDEIFDIVEDQPEFPGGIAAFYKLVSIKYELSQTSS